VPAVAIIIGILYPFVLGIYYSFLDYSATNQSPALVGLKNFQNVVSDPNFWHSVLVTVEYAVVATGVETLLGIGVALLLNRASRIGRFFERLLILPLMIAPVIAATVWKLMYNPQFGVINYMLGLGRFDWLSKDTALWSSILVDLWIYTPFVAILVLAGIRSLPKERRLVVHVPPADAADAVAVHPRRGHLPLHGLPEDLRHHLRAHGRRPRQHDDDVAGGRLLRLHHQPQLLARVDVHVPAVGHRLRDRALSGGRAGQGAAAGCRGGGLGHGIS
jgi:ABC-type amino acid transport system permease subunit